MATAISIDGKTVSRQIKRQLAERIALLHVQDIRPMHDVVTAAAEISERMGFRRSYPPNR